MRTIFMTILMVAIVLTGFKFFIADSTNGIWGNAKTIKSLKDTEVNGSSIPSG